MRAFAMLSVMFAALLWGCIERNPGNTGVRADLTGISDLDTQPKEQASDEIASPANSSADHSMTHDSTSAGAVTASPVAAGDVEPAVVQAPPPNPGAVALVNVLVDAIGIDDPGPVGPLVVIRPFRNQSRGSVAELEELRTRLHAMLSANAEPGRVRFALEPSPEAEYTLGGTVYLLTRDGFDFWETYVALRPAGANWTLWRNDQPIRLLRQSRAEADTLLFTDDGQP